MFSGIGMILILIGVVMGNSECLIVPAGILFIGTALALYGILFRGEGECYEEESDR